MQKQYKNQKKKQQKQEKEKKNENEMQTNLQTSKKKQDKTPKNSHSAEGGVYTKTCNLFNSKFELRPQPNVFSKMLSFWKERGLYSTKLHAGNHANNSGETTVRFLDGPPYANGNLHLGHSLNKVQKDGLLKWSRLKGLTAPFVPQWDCHGLPIELEVEKKFKLSKDSHLPEERRQKCREFAGHWVEVQKAQFQEMGVLADFDHAVLSMHPTYEAAELENFGKFAPLVERDLKTVPWCVNCATTLSKSEMEYTLKDSPSLYLLFPMTKPPSFFQAFLTQTNLATVHVLAWTTTPYTLPLNRAVFLNPKAQYALVFLGKPPPGLLRCAASFPLLLVMALDLVLPLMTAFQAEAEVHYSVLTHFEPSVVEKTLLQHPCDPHREVPLLLDAFVSVRVGEDKEEEEEDQTDDAKPKGTKVFSAESVPTGCVHSAPGAGEEDYTVGKLHNLEVYCPINDKGVYTPQVVPASLQGLFCQTKGSDQVLSLLQDTGRLFSLQKCTHRYPCCWRCKKALMFRASAQWFCNLSTVVEQAAQMTQQAVFYPASGQKTMQSLVCNRSEWCVSRQRVWGVPVPGLVCQRCPVGFFLTEQLAQWVAEGVRREGLEFWDRVSLQELAKTFQPVCRKCGNSNVDEFRKETDVLDVWFDSGAAAFHDALAKPNSPFVPYDFVFEGKDQFRDGFVVDELGRKFSKSLGNGVSPSEILKQYNPDVLRMWACGSDASKDVTYSAKVMASYAQDYCKLRTVFRWCLSNLLDVKLLHQLETVPSGGLCHFDTLMMSKLHEFSREMSESFNSGVLANGYRCLMNFVRSTFTSFVEVAKMRLYFERVDSPARRSAQYVVYHMFQVLVSYLSVMASFLAEEVAMAFWDQLDHRPDEEQSYTSVFEKPLFVLPALAGESLSFVREWEHFSHLKSTLHQAVESQRKQLNLKSHDIHLNVDPATFSSHLFKCCDYAYHAEDFFEAVQVDFDLKRESPADSLLVFTPAKKHKCPRCRRFAAEEPDHCCSYCLRLL